jgi:pimeloyl-ACP methyl ester carboxylesterase
VGWYTNNEFQDAAKSWKGDDFQSVVLHSYRSRWGHAELNPKYATLQARFESTWTLSTPTLLLHGREDRCELAETTDGAERYFTAGYGRVLLDGVGHYPQRESPQVTGAAILDHLKAQLTVRNEQCRKAEPPPLQSLHEEDASESYCSRNY